jgi:hypothetical protein
MHRHVRSSRRRWAWSIGRPLVFFAATSGIAAMEAAKIADARATVASGWAAGFAVVIAASRVAQVRKRPLSPD